MAKADAPLLDRDKTPVPRDMVIGVKEASEIVGVTERTIERHVDRGWLAGGRPTNRKTGRPLANSKRWVDARDAVRVAVSKGLGHLVPAKWQWLVERTLANANDSK